MRDIDAVFRIGIVHGGNASGLGGGDVHGLAPHVLSGCMYELAVEEEELELLDESSLSPQEMRLRLKQEIRIV